jgi:alkane 1-monooxygenase
VERDAMNGSKKLGYMLFLLPSLTLGTTMLAAYRIGHWNAWGFAPLVVVFMLIPALDLLIGKDVVNPTRDEEAALREDRFYSGILVACLPVQVLALAAGIALVSRMPLGVAGFVGWTLSFGLASSVLAITAGHELIHRGKQGMRMVGGALLATVGYASFKIEHVLGHHVHVATPDDPSTARRGQNVYGFVARAFYTNIPRAFALEKAHAVRRKKSHGVLTSELVRWTLLTFALGGLSALLGGWLGLAFFGGQAVIAIALLEVINFVEHYGLERRSVGTRGGYEVTTAAHSWNSNYLLSNWILFQLQRHSDHHANAARPYQVLRSLEVSPELPAGYPTMVMLALVPPLYRAIMEPKLAALAQA